MRCNLPADLGVGFALRVDVAHLADDPAGAEHQQPVHEPYELRQIRRDHDDRFSLPRREIPDQLMDLLLRLGPLGVRAHEIGFVLDYGERVGQSKMKVLRTIRQTLGLLARRRLESVTRFSSERLRQRLEEAERAAARPSR